MKRELIVKATECKTCTTIGNNLKSVIPAKQFRPRIPYVEPNQEIQIDFGGAFFGEKGNVVFFIAARDHFSKYPTSCIYEKANRPDALKFLDMYIEYRGIPRSIRLDQAKCLVGNQVEIFCNKINIDIIEALVNDLRAIGLAERLIQMIKNRLACIKEDKSSKKAFKTNFPAIQHQRHEEQAALPSGSILPQKSASLSAL